MKTVTIDTNVLPADDLIERAKQKDWDVASTSVTEREMGSGDARLSVPGLGHVMETAVFDESPFGISVLGSEEDGKCFESTLQIIFNGSFPKPGHRNCLSDGQKRQLRDAIILCAHARDKREVFVSDDRKAFVDDGRRDALETLLRTRILTRKEFLDQL